ncbi:hypothetical protein TNIN_259011 [Trichonephila inaurata madagascariensis]|uniref:Uncharacterized protein n=1 Tax=Trichonephila inaurata madagascariensis TaxID=2747483 RepID=A0A8X6YJC6_9ARAC|nr:hypothetical protein TNIN_259011 [Trichonephila inaurata madagascariensis]
MHSIRSLFGFDFFVFEGGEHDLTRVKKPPVARESDKLAERLTVGFLINNFVQKMHHTVEAGVVFNMFAIAAISSRHTHTQIIVNKYLQKSKRINWNELTVDDFVVVACVADSVVEDFVIKACVVHQS